MFNVEKIYYEKEILKYDLGNKIMNKYPNIEKIEISNHNNIEELRKRNNVDFPILKNYLILGIRKTQKFVVNHKLSNYLVPYTSSGCMAMCLYCYLVCHFNKCSYLRIFVNREQLLQKLIKESLKSDKELVYEIGSNSDLLLENTITGNLPWTIEEFAKINKGYITFPTKFSNVDCLLKLKHNKRTIIRMSVNPNYIISNVEYRTSSLNDRIEAINKLVEAGYPVGILIAPIILVDNYKKLYKELIITLHQKLSKKVKEQLFFEVIFMTYSYIHTKINEEAFPKAIRLYNQKIMQSRGIGKYTYQKELKLDMEIFIRNLLKIYFKDNKVLYVS